MKKNNKKERVLSPSMDVRLKAHAKGSGQALSKEPALSLSKGFTLIELIMVIVILGILSAVIVPKFFEFTEKAHKANIDAVKGAIRAALNNFAADRLINSGKRTFPKSGGGLGVNFGRILDESPEGWTVAQANAADQDTIRYTGTNPDSAYGYRLTATNSPSDLTHITTDSNFYKLVKITVPAD